jgi:hypothetical protein
MARFQYLNVEPHKTKKNDCVTRAITFASGMEYPEVRKMLYHSARLLKCPKLCPTCYSFAIQEVLGGVPTNCNGMTVGDFADLHPHGTYLIRIQGHLLAIKDNCVYDLWDNRNRFCDLAWKMHN